MDHERFEYMVLTILDPSEAAEVSGCNNREKQYKDLGVQARNLSKVISEMIPG